MIVKTDRDGRFFVAGNGNWRLAGPFDTHADAWAWIDRNGFKNDGPAPAPRPVQHVRQPKTNTSVTFEDVNRHADHMLSKPIEDREREFIMQMQKRSRRKSPYLRSTDKQAAWWKRLEKKYGVQA